MRGYMKKDLADLGDFRVIGKRADGAMVVVTAEVYGDTNTFEVVECDQGHTHVREHDAEGFRKEREANNV